MPKLRAALVTPLTGTLGEFGRASAAGLGLWAARAAHLPAPFDGIALEVVDSGSDPASAMRAAAVRPDVVFGPYGSSPALEAIRATRRVVWNHGGATSRLCSPEFPRVVNVLSPASSYFAGALRAVRAADPEAATAAALYRDSSGFGRDVISGSAQSAAGLGFDLHTVRFESGRAAEAASTLPAADVLLVVGGFEEELDAARALLRRSWPAAAAFVGAGVEEVLAPLGKGREGLLGPAQWLAAAAPEPDEGPDAGWFVERYRRRLGSDPPYPAVQAFAAGVLCARCLREAGGSDDAAQLAAARELQCTTLYGRFRLDPQSGLQTGHEVLTVQWQDGARRVVWPWRQAERPLSYPLTG